MNTILTLGLLAGLLLMVAGFARWIKRKDMAIGIGALIFIISGLPFLGIDYSTISVVGEGIPTPPAELPAIPQDCSGVSSVSTNFIVYNKEKTKTATSVTSAYFLTGSKSGNQSVSSLSLAPATPHQAIIGYGVWGTTTNYYPTVYDFSTTCNAQDFTVFQPQSGSLTASIINDDGVTKNSATNNQTVDASDKREVSLTLDVGTQKYFGAESCKNVMCPTWDATYIDEVSFPDLKAVGTPTAYDAPNSSYDDVKCYEFDQLINGAKKEFALTLEATSSWSDGALTGHPVIQVFDCNIDVDQETGELIYAVEDEDANKLMNNPKNVTFYVQ